MSHERSATTPSSSPVLPIGSVLHRNDEEDGVLVLHFVNVYANTRPIARILLNVGVQACTQLLDDLKRRVVRAHEVRRFPPIDIAYSIISEKNRTVLYKTSHGAAASQIVN